MPENIMHSFEARLHCPTSKVPILRMFDSKRLEQRFSKAFLLKLLQNTFTLETSKNGGAWSRKINIVKGCNNTSTSYYQINVSCETSCYLIVTPGT